VASRVLSVGDGRILADGKRIPHQVSEGDRVLFGRYAGTEVMVNGEELVIISEKEFWLWSCKNQDTSRSGEKSLQFQSRRFPMSVKCFIPVCC